MLPAGSARAWGKVTASLAKDPLWGCCQAGAGVGWGASRLAQRAALSGTPVSCRHECSAHHHGFPGSSPLCPQLPVPAARRVPSAPHPQPPMPTAPRACTGYHAETRGGKGVGGARLWAVPVPQQPHARCGPQVGGGLPLLLCWDDLHGLVQAGLQAGSSPSRVVCVAGDAGSCKRAPRDGGSPLPPRRDRAVGHMSAHSPGPGSSQDLLGNTQMSQSQPKTLLSLVPYRYPNENCQTKEQVATPYKNPAELLGGPVGT